MNKTAVSTMARSARAAPPTRPLSRFAVLVLCVMALAACKVDLYADLDQRQANDIVATLLRHGIPADRVVDRNGKVTVTVGESHFAEAVRILNDNGLPKQDFATLGEVFKKEGLVSSPVQERAQMIYALSQELSRTVSDIDGVLSARVHLVLPENDPLRQRLIPSSASVFIRHQASLLMADLVPQVKLLVANGIAGLSYDKVSVILIPVQTEGAGNTDPGFTSFWGLWLHRDSLTRAAWLLYGLTALVVFFAGALGLVLWQQRQRVYPLQPQPRVKLQ